MTDQLLNRFILLAAFACFAAAYFILKNEYLEMSPDYEYRNIGLLISAIFFSFFSYFFVQSALIDQSGPLQTIIRVISHGN